MKIDNPYFNAPEAHQLRMQNIGTQGLMPFGPNEDVTLQALKEQTLILFQERDGRPNTPTLETVQFMHSAVQLLIDSLQLNSSRERDEAMHTIQTEIYKCLQSDPTCRSPHDVLNGIVREANAFHLLLPSYQIFRSVSLDLYHGIDGILFNGRNYLPIDINPATTEETSTGLRWILAVPTRPLDGQSHIFEFPYSLTRHPRRSLETMRSMHAQLEEGFQTKGLTADQYQQLLDHHLS